MINFDFNQHCCGCTSCANSCPTGAIRMLPDEDGFLMPSIDKDKCIDCGACDKRCPHLNTQVDIQRFSLDDFKGMPAYLYYSNKPERINSASGGFVYDAFMHFVENGGYAVGCIWNEELKACHVVCHNKEGVIKTQSSKYVQSDLGDCFRKIRDLLRQGEKIAFCGTPCQTAGVKQYLGKLSESEQFLSICLICHGVASPKVWQFYKGCLERKYDMRMVNANMRDKHNKGYSLSYARYAFAKSVSGRSLETSVSWPTYLSDPYIYLFTDDLYLRNSCYSCKYKSVHTGADIIVGDFYASTQGAGNEGCSCLVALTDKGNQTIHSLDGTIKPSSIEEVGGVNGMICHSVVMNPKRNQFFADLNNNPDMGMDLFKKYLPFRFYVKNVLGRLGLFKVVKKILG